MAKSRLCPRCQGPTEKRQVEHPYWHGQDLVALVQNVPAWVCLLCSHQYYEPTVKTTLALIVKDYIRIGRLFPIPQTPYREISKQ
jgi:YgiT-type zinc finger domain-containing protein